MHLLALHGTAECHSSSGAETSLIGWAGQLGDRDTGVLEKDLTTAGSVEQREQTLWGSMVQLWLGAGGGGGGPRRGPWAAGCSASLRGP